jgi:hypothetical protein
MGRVTSSEASSGGVHKGVCSRQVWLGRIEASREPPITADVSAAETQSFAIGARSRRQAKRCAFWPRPAKSRWDADVTEKKAPVSDIPCAFRGVARSVSTIHLDVRCLMVDPGI